MKKAYQENNLDIEFPVIWSIAPNYDTQRTPSPFVVDESGKFFAREEFFSKREGLEGHLILYTQEGKGLLRYKGGEYILLPGSIALIDCNESHEYKTLGSSWVFYWLHFFCGYMNFYSQAIYGDSFALLEAAVKPPRIFDKITNNLKYSDPGRLVLLNDCVHKILMLMADSKPFAEKPKPAPPIRPARPVRVKKPSIKKISIMEGMKRVAEAMKQFYWHSFDLENTARSFNMSKFNFIRVFADYAGMPPHRFLLNARIDEAKILLRKDDRRISEVGAMVGFPDERNFTRIFKSVTGVSPGYYRKSEQK